MCVDGKLGIIDVRVVGLDHHSSARRSDGRHILSKLDERRCPVRGFGPIGFDGDQSGDYDRDGEDQPLALSNCAPKLTEMQPLFLFAVAVSIVVCRRLRVARRPRVMRAHKRSFLKDFNFFELDSVV